MRVRPEELAALLVARRRAAEDAHRRRAAALRRALDEVLAEAASDGAIRRAWLIGSLARGAFGAGSDVDVVVEGLAADRIGTLWGQLSERLGAHVDLLRLEDLPIDFRQRVVDEGTRLVA